MSAYCTPALVKTFSQIVYTQLGFASDDAFGTFLSGTVIPTAQRIIDKYVNHNFQSNSGTVKLDGNGKNVLMVPPPYLPILDVSAVTVDDVDVTSSIKKYATYLALDSGNFGEDFQNVEVVLTYGYASVPEDIQFVCAEIAAHQLTEMLRRKVTPDVIARLMMQSDDIKSLPSLGRSSKILTPELQADLDKYVFSHMDVT